MRKIALMALIALPLFAGFFPSAVHTSISSVGENSVTLRSALPVNGMSAVVVHDYGNSLEAIYTMMSCQPSKQLLVQEIRSLVDIFIIMFYFWLQVLTPIQGSFHHIIKNGYIRIFLHFSFLKRERLSQLKQILQDLQKSKSCKICKRISSRTYLYRT